MSTPGSALRWGPEAAAVLLVVGLLVPRTRHALRVVIGRFARWYCAAVPATGRYGVIVAAAVTGVVIGGATQGVHGLGRVHVVIALAVAQTAATGLPLYEQRQTVRTRAEVQRQLEEARTLATQARNHEFNLTLRPVTGALVELLDADPATKPELRGSAITTALTAASTLLGGTGDVRATRYEVRGNKPHRRLAPVGPSLGRADQAVTEFREDDGDRGGHLFHELDTRSVLNVENVTVDPPVGFPSGLSPVWKSLIQAPLTWRGKPIGMLSVDSPRPADFDRHEDMALAVVIADLLTAVIRA